MLLLLVLPPCYYETENVRANLCFDSNHHSVQSADDNSKFYFKKTLNSFGTKNSRKLKPET